MQIGTAYTPYNELYSVDFVPLQMALQKPHSDFFPLIGALLWFPVVSL